MEKIKKLSPVQSSKFLFTDRLTSTKKIVSRLASNDRKYHQVKNNWNTNDAIYLYNGSTKSKTNTYLGDIHQTTYLFKVNDFKLKDWISFLGLKLHPKSEWRELITIFQNIEKDYLSQYSRYEDVVAPKSERKSSSRVKLDEDEYSVYTLRKSVHCSTSGTFDNKILTYKELKESKTPIIYAHHDYKINLAPYIFLVPNATIMTVAKKDLKDFEDIPNATHYTDIKKHELVLKAMTSLKVHKFKNCNKYLFQNTDLIKYINKDSDILKSIEVFNNYIDDYYESSLSSSFAKNLYTWFTDNNLWDTSLDNDFKVLEKVASDFESLQHLESRYNGIEIVSSSFE